MCPLWKFLLKIHDASVMPWLPNLSLSFLSGSQMKPLHHGRNKKSSNTIFTIFISYLQYFSFTGILLVLPFHMEWIWESNKLRKALIFTFNQTDFSITLNWYCKESCRVPRHKASWAFMLPRLFNLKMSSFWITFCLSRFLQVYRTNWRNFSLDAVS